MPLIAIHNAVCEPIAVTDLPYSIWEQLNRDHKATLIVVESNRPALVEPLDLSITVPIKQYEMTIFKEKDVPFYYTLDDKIVRYLQPYLLENQAQSLHSNNVMWIQQGLKIFRSNL